MLNLGLRRRRSFFLALLGSRSVLGLWISFFGFGLCLLYLSFNFFGLGSVLGL